MKKIKVYLKDTTPVYNTKRSRIKPRIHTLAAVFKNYDMALERADALFEVFSPERLQAQTVALDKLRQRLKDLNIENIDWNDAYTNVVKYAKPRGIAA